MSTDSTVTGAIFAVSVLLLAWAFGVYPLVLMLIHRTRGGSRIQKAPVFPMVTVMVPTFRESKVIERRIRNVFESDYPLDKLEVLIVDSASPDGTADVVNEFILNCPDKPIRLLVENERRGKVSAVNMGLKAARGEIVIITDGPTLYKPDTIRNVVSNFADPQVGAATGHYGFPKRDTGVDHAEGIFWDFKNVLRQLEGNVESTSFLSGELCAFRRGLISDLGEASGDDVYVGFRTRDLGYRAIADPQAIFYEKKPSTFSELQIRKTSALQVGMIESWRFRHMLFRPRYGLFGLLIFPSNLLSTVLSPFVLIVAAITGSWWLLGQLGWSGFVGAVVLILLGSIVVQILSGKNVLKVAIFFLFNEWIILRAFFKCISGDYSVLWEQASSVREV